MSKLGQQLIRPADLLLRPQLTEKASVADRPVYTFVISPRANKAAVKRAVKELYQVTPVMVNIINLPAKKKLVRGRIGHKVAVRKAVVYLKPGDKIDLAA